MTKLIPLRNHKGDVIANTIVDDTDFDWLSLLNWSKRQCGHHTYVVTTKKTNARQTWTHMHRLIMNAPPGVFVDHRDGDGLNNTRSNLRLATRTQNQQNTDGQRTRIGKYKGVYFFNGKHRARICVNKKQLYIGGFDLAEDAALAYNAAAILHFGEFAHLNVITQEPTP